MTSGSKVVQHRNEPLSQSVSKRTIKKFFKWLRVIFSDEIWKWLRPFWPVGGQWSQGTISWFVDWIYFLIVVMWYGSLVRAPIIHMELRFIWWVEGSREGIFTIKNKRQFNFLNLKVAGNQRPRMSLINLVANNSRFKTSTLIHWTTFAFVLWLTYEQSSAKWELSLRRRSD